MGALQPRLPHRTRPLRDRHDRDVAPARARDGRDLPPVGPARRRPADRRHDRGRPDRLPRVLLGSARAPTARHRRQGIAADRRGLEHSRRLRPGISRLHDLVAAHDRPLPAAAAGLHGASQPADAFRAEPATRTAGGGSSPKNGTRSKAQVPPSGRPQEHQSRANAADRSRRLAESSTRDPNAAVPGHSRRQFREVRTRRSRGGHPRSRRGRPGPRDGRNARSASAPPPDRRRRRRPAFAQGREGRERRSGDRRRRRLAGPAGPIVAHRTQGTRSRSVSSPRRHRTDRAWTSGRLDAGEDRSPGGPQRPAASSRRTTTLGAPPDRAVVAAATSNPSARNVASVPV